MIKMHWQIIFRILTDCDKIFKKYAQIKKADAVKQWNFS